MFETTRGKFSQAQVNQLLQPIRPNRVLQAQGHSHVSQQDITAHLIRMFGFGNFDIEVMSIECIFEEPRANAQGELTGRWDVAYRALVRLSIRNEHGEPVAFYENGSTGDAQNQTRAGGHDLAYKSAISLSIKRAAIALGDQFGLSLYNKGQLDALVIRTIIGGEDSLTGDVQDGVAQQVALGNDEVEKDTPVEAVVDVAVSADVFDAIADAMNVAQLQEIYNTALAQGYADKIRPALTDQRKFLEQVAESEANNG